MNFLRFVLFLILFLFIAFPLGGIYVLTGGLYDPAVSVFSPVWSFIGNVLASWTPTWLKRLYFHLSGFFYILILSIWFLFDTILALSTFYGKIRSVQFWIGHSDEWFTEDVLREDTPFMRYGLLGWPYGWLKLQFFGHPGVSHTDLDEIIAEQQDLTGKKPFSVIIGSIFRSGNTDSAIDDDRTREGLRKRVGRYFTGFSLSSEHIEVKDELDEEPPIQLHGPEPPSSSCDD